MAICFLFIFLIGFAGAAPPTSHDDVHIGHDGLVRLKNSAGHGGQILGKTVSQAEAEGILRRDKRHNIAESLMNEATGEGLDEQCNLDSINPEELANSRQTHLKEDAAASRLNRQLPAMAKQIIDNTRFTGVRLPASIKPKHYDISLKPDFDKFTFEGRVKIDYECVGDSVPDSIVLHANELAINEGSLQAGNSTRTLTTVTYSNTTETATLEFEGGIASTGTLILKFTGILNDKLKGFYRTTFKIGTSEVHAAATQFEATDARRCFPCWDEPAAKATFSSELIINKFVTVNGKQYERVALSNMPEISRMGSDDELHVKFAKTPIMSTYLLAFIVGPFEYIEGSDSRRPIRVYTTPGKKEHGRFALDVACKSLPYYEDYFNVPYPLPKMDLIAIPDFSSGAMENWGLVTYRETALLMDPQNTATSARHYIALVVAHELAHQWFGNLVTMEWWTHLWLNEGFATFMEYLCVDHIFPEFDIWSQFSTMSYSVALDLDSLHSSHPIEVVVNDPSQIREIFDAISYHKGSSVIRMLYKYIGDDCFRAGMKDYLQKFEYKNAATEDLWDCLEAASNKPVRKLMSGWTGQKGFPWLEVSYSSDGNQTKLSLTQSQFTADGKLSDDEASVKWLIPISAITGKNPAEPKEICLLDGKSTEVTLGDVGGDWIKLNPGAIGLYRTAYPEELVAKLSAAIASRTLPPLDRLGLQSDFCALCQAGKVGTVEMLKLLQAFKNETSYNVWLSIDDCISRLGTVLSGTDYIQKYYAFGRELYGDIFKKLTWCPKTGESDDDAMTRALVINRLVAFQEKAVVEEALRKFKAHLEKTETIPADLRGAVYRAVSSSGDEAAFEGLFTIHKSADLHEEKNRVARSLGFTKNAERLKRVMKFALSDEVRNQDKSHVILTLGASNPEESWEFFKENKDVLQQKLQSGPILTRIVEFCTKYLMSEEKAREVEAFFKDNKFPQTDRKVQQSVERIRLNVAWLARDGNKVKAFLTAQM